MLEQQKQATAPATQARVSPQELVQAVAALESRRQAEAQAQRETLLLGEAVEALGIMDSPAEVFAEVQSQRAQQTSSETHSRKRPHALPWLLAASLLGNISLGGVLLRANRHHSQPSRQAAPAAPVPSNLIVPRLKSLADIRVGETFHCDLKTALDISKGKTNAIVDVNPTSQDLWTLARTSGGIVLQAWAMEPEALALLNGKEGTVQNAPDDGTGGLIKYSPVSIPMERLRGAASGIYNNTYMTIPAIRPAKPGR